MNLYNVYPRNGEWNTFVFHYTRNQARMKMINHYSYSGDGEQYTDLNAICLTKDIEEKLEIKKDTLCPSVIDSETNLDYSLVQKLGYSYMSEKESEEYYDRSN